jgi:hypothetical protein
MYRGMDEPFGACAQAKPVRESDSWNERRARREQAAPAE